MILAYLMMPVVYTSLLLSIVVFNISIAAVTDTPYYQDIPHRSVFNNSKQVADWEILPFENLDGPIVHVTAREKRDIIKKRYLILLKSLNDKRRKKTSIKKLRSSLKRHKKMLRNWQKPGI